MSLLDDLPLPEAFKKAYRAEVGLRAGSVKRLAYLLRWIQGGRGRDRKGPLLDPVREAEHDFTQWMLHAVRAKDGKASIRKLLRALEEVEHPSSRLLTTKRITMGIYVELVFKGHRDITKQVLWNRVEKMHEALGLPAPQHRARILAEIGLADLPQAHPGRRRR